MASVWREDVWYYLLCGLIVLSEFFGFNHKSKKSCIDSNPIGIEVTLHYLAHYAWHGIFAVLNKADLTYEMRAAKWGRKSFKPVSDQESQHCAFRHQFESAWPLCRCHFYVVNLNSFCKCYLTWLSYTLKVITFSLITTFQRISTDVWPNQHFDFKVTTRNFQFLIFALHACICFEVNERETRRRIIMRWCASFWQSKMGDFNMKKAKQCKFGGYRS